MKKLIMTLFIITAVLSSVLLMTGCEDKEEETHTAFVLGLHENFPMPSPTTMYDDIYTSVYSGGKIIAVVSDGNADTVSYDAEFDLEESTGTDTKKQRAEGTANSVIYEFLKLNADCPETDPLKAITTSANVLNAIEQGNKIIRIYDSGLSTTGLLNLTDKAVSEATPEQITEGLKKIHALPDLSGITVRWSGFGQTCGEQQPLPASYVNKLKSLWKHIIIECGGDVSFDDAPISDGRNSYDLPECSTVEVWEDKLLSDTSVIIEN